MAVTLIWGIIAMVLIAIIVAVIAVAIHHSNKD